MSEHRVLVIAYYFPPLGLSGVQRTLKFVKYLPEFGWHPTVLTVEDRGYFARDEGLLRELEGIPAEVIRTPSLDPLHLFGKKQTVRMPSPFAYGAFGKLSQLAFIPDNKIGWRRHAVAAARTALRERQFDVLFATAPPYTDFLIGEQLKKEFGIPLVLDYRDAWHENPLHWYATPLHRFLHHRLEQRVVRHADHIITINRQIKEATVRANPSLSHHDVTIISQGFDAEDFQGSEGTNGVGKMRITYAGTFYFNRTPLYFLQALRSFFEQHQQARSRIEVCFVGNTRAVDEQLVRELGLDDVVRFHGYLPHEETVRLLLRSDVLWLMIGSGMGEEMMSTGKLYEYIGARKPILATIPEGAASQTLRKHGAVFLAAPEDVEAITERLTTLYALHQTNRLPSPSDAFHEQFDRRRLTSHLSRVFLSVIHEDSAESVEAETSETHNRMPT